MGYTCDFYSAPQLWPQMRGFFLFGLFPITIMQNDSSPAEPSHDEGIRLNKYLASCGYESRRKADQLIAEGAVEINGKRVETPGVRVQPGDFVKVNGHRALPKDEVSLLLNKPRGFVCSRDPQGAQGTVFDLLPPKYRYVNYVGRLDTDSEGLLILTNKGDLNQRLGHPTAGIEKEYWVTLDQHFENSVLLQLLKGVRIPEGQAKAKFISRLSPRRACVVLEQGLKRQVRQMFACLGLRVRKLVRVRIGSLWGGDLAPGRAMLMTPEQEKLAATNPPQRKGLISAAQAFPKTGGEISADMLARALDEKAARAALEEETDYKFNPADFESDEDVQETPFRAWDDDDFQPARRPGRDFRSTPRDANKRFERRGAEGSGRPFRRFGDRDERSFGRRSGGDDRPFRRRAEGDRGFGRRADSGRPFRRAGQDAAAPRQRRFSAGEFAEGESRFSRSHRDEAPRRFHRDFSDRDFSADKPRRFRSERPASSPRSGSSRPDNRGGFSRSNSFRKPGSRPGAPKRGRRF